MTVEEIISTITQPMEIGFGVVWKTIFVILNSFLPVADSQSIASFRYSMFYIANFGKQFSFLIDWEFIWECVLIVVAVEIYILVIKLVLSTIKILRS